MLKEFQKHISQIEGVNIDQDRFLLAVSGGMDSSALAGLFYWSKYNFGIAHCNFLLRDVESVADADFVRKWAANYEVPFYLENFETKEIASERKISIQMAARDLRYEWLEKIRSEHAYDWIVTAHHLNDSLETVIYNLAKGTGLKGLLGIPEKNGFILRPLLPFPKEEIEECCNALQIPFREDSSNAESKYARNLIRHQIIPTLKKLNPSLLDTFEHTLANLKDGHKLQEETLALWKEKCVEDDDEKTIVHYKPLMEHVAPATLLYHFLSFAAFHSKHIQQILQAIEAQKVGLYFHSSTHQLLLDRETLIIKLRKTDQDEVHFFDKDGIGYSAGQSTFFFTHLEEYPAQFDTSGKMVYFNTEELVFPLILRRWQAGDYFCPLGMNGKRKKLQDLFTDKKLNRFEKEEVWVLQNGDGRICWVVGIQIDNRFKITPKSQKIYKIEWRP